MSTTARSPELPAFYDPANAASWAYRPDLQAVLGHAMAWRRERGITPAAADRHRVHALLIDVQKDFCFPEGTLYVGGRSGTGAIDDSRRLAEFLYRNAAVITGITATFDTHHAHQIFFSSFWVDAGGQPPAPHRVVTVDDLDSGRLRPNPDLVAWLGRGQAEWLARQAHYYCQELERAGKYQLYLWPPHCILGSDGHALVGVIQEARMFHAFLRSAPDRSELKGRNALSEFYSVFSTEVSGLHDGGPGSDEGGERNAALLDALLSEDAILVAGQAASHCVKSSIEDLLDEIRRRDRALARKVYVLVDCMSSVAVPDGKGGLLADFTPQAEAALARFAEAGMHLVRSTDPIESWPDWRG
jgi:nicotinamidase-related amidase